MASLRVILDPFPCALGILSDKNHSTLEKTTSKQAKNLFTIVNYPTAMALLNANDENGPMSNVVRQITTAGLDSSSNSSEPATLVGLHSLQTEESSSPTRESDIPTKESNNLTQENNNQFPIQNSLFTNATKNNHPKQTGTKRKFEFDVGEYDYEDPFIDDEDGNPESASTTLMIIPEEDLYPVHSEYYIEDISRATAKSKPTVSKSKNNETKTSTKEVHGKSSTTKIQNSSKTGKKKATASVQAVSSGASIKKKKSISNIGATFYSANILSGEKGAKKKTHRPSSLNDFDKIKAQKSPHSKVPLKDHSSSATMVTKTSMIPLNVSSGSTIETLSLGKIISCTTGEEPVTAIKKIKKRTGSEFAIDGTVVSQSISFGNYGGEDQTYRNQKAHSDSLSSQITNKHINASQITNDHLPSSQLMALGTQKNTMDTLGQFSNMLVESFEKSWNEFNVLTGSDVDKMLEEISSKLLLMLNVNHRTIFSIIQKISNDELVSRTLSISQSQKEKILMIKTAITAIKDEKKPPCSLQKLIFEFVEEHVILEILSMIIKEYLLNEMHCTKEIPSMRGKDQCDGFIAEHHFFADDIVHPLPRIACNDGNIVSNIDLSHESVTSEKIFSSDLEISDVRTFTPETPISPQLPSNKELPQSTISKEYELNLIQDAQTLDSFKIQASRKIAYALILEETHILGDHVKSSTFVKAYSREKKKRISLLLDSLYSSSQSVSSLVLSDGHSPNACIPTLSSPSELVVETNFSDLRLISNENTEHSFSCNTELGPTFPRLFQDTPTRPLASIPENDTCLSSLDEDAFPLSPNNNTCAFFLEKCPHSISLKPDITFTESSINEEEKETSSSFNENGFMFNGSSIGEDLSSFPCTSPECFNIASVENSSFDQITGSYSANLSHSTDHAHFTNYVPSASDSSMLTNETPLPGSKYLLHPQPSTGYTSMPQGHFFKDLLQRELPNVEVPLVDQSRTKVYLENNDIPTRRSSIDNNRNCSLPDKDNRISNPHTLKRILTSDETGSIRAAVFTHLSSMQQKRESASVHQKQDQVMMTQIRKDDHTSPSSSMLSVQKENSTDTMSVICQDQQHFSTEALKISYGPAESLQQPFHDYFTAKHDPFTQNLSLNQSHFAICDSFEGKNHVKNNSNFNKDSHSFSFPEETKEQTILGLTQEIQMANEQKVDHRDNFSINELMSSYDDNPSHTRCNRLGEYQQEYVMGCEFTSPSTESSAESVPSSPSGLITDLVVNPIAKSMINSVFAPEPVTEQLNYDQLHISDIRVETEEQGTDIPTDDALLH